MVDTRDLKSLVGNSVRVRIPSPAPVLDVFKCFCVPLFITSRQLCDEVSILGCGELPRENRVYSGSSIRR